MILGSEAFSFIILVESSFVSLLPQDIASNKIK
jgi:hypothetical protein